MYTKHRNDQNHERKAEASTPSVQYDSSLRRFYHLGKVVGWGAGEEVTVGFHQREQPEEGVLGGQEESVGPFS